MDVCKKSVILGLTLLGFCVLVETMGFCKFAKMFPNQGKKELIENKTLQEDKGTHCPSGYTKQLHDSCYKFVDSGTGATRSAARSACKGNSSHLVYIETKEENDFLVGDADSNTQYWIGIHERPNLFWDNGNQVTFANIDPDNYRTFDADTGCYRMSANDERHWLDKSCFVETGYICEYEGTDCPSGYTKQLHNSCYKFVGSGTAAIRANRSAARSACKGDSSHLVYIETKEENDFLVGEAESNTEYWIGIHQRPNLFWDNGNQVTFANMDPDEPTTFNQDTDCYRMSNNDERYWLDDDCSKVYGSICEFEGTDCPSGYTKQLNDSCYKFVDSGLGATRSAATSACKDNSSHLVYIETKEENEFLIGEAENNTQYWIGIHERPNLFWDNGNQVIFAHIDPYNSVTFNDDTGCYRMTNNDERYWYDYHCYANYRFICEYEGTDCPSGYIKQLHDSCYKFVDSGTGATRSAARSVCKNDSAHLVYIETKEENEFLIGEAENNFQYWTGIHERPNLFWDNGNQVTFANIDPDNYKTFDEDTGCYRMSANNEKYWMDDDCSTEHGYICEYEE